MPLQRIRGPICEPISLADAKLHLRVDVTDDDTLISAFITAAREYAEQITKRAIIAQDWKLVFDSFPGPSLMGVPWGKPFTLPGHALEIEKSQVQVISAINYLDMTGSAQVMPASDYAVDYSSEPCRITPIFGQIWPIPLPQIAANNVEFTAGYAAPIVADATANTITVQGAWKAYAVGDPVRFSNVGGALPTPLVELTDYYILTAPGNGVYTLAETSGGTEIDLTDVGTGNSLIGEIPEGIKSWMKLRVGSLYQHREENLAEARVKLQPIPFVDCLLDPYTVYF